MELNRWLMESELIVCVGSGGVGKTTTAAAIALAAARRGRSVLVLTIDPARRLANSLGLSQFGNEATRIDTSAIRDVSGELWAMMLDSRGTFDNLIHRISPSDEVKERILNNHVYRHLSDTFAGSQDYMATETIFDVSLSGKYDLLVLDTPPVKNALDFLESPGRLVKFLDKRVLKWFLDTSGSTRAKRYLFGTSRVVYYLLGKVFGEQFIEDLSEFFQDFSGLYDGFRKRHQAVIELFRRQTTSFVAVCSPSESSVDIAGFFLKELLARELPCAGVLVNQVHYCDGGDHNAAKFLSDLVEAEGKEYETITRASVIVRLGMAHRRLAALCNTEKELISAVKNEFKLLPGGFYKEIPRLDGEVHDLASLEEVGDHIFYSSVEAGIKPAVGLE